MFQASSTRLVNSHECLGKDLGSGSTRCSRVSYCSELWNHWLNIDHYIPTTLSGNLTPGSKSYSDLVRYLDRLCLHPTARTLKGFQ